jgi:hypothetical protein
MKKKQNFCLFAKKILANKVFLDKYWLFVNYTNFRELNSCNLGFVMDNAFLGAPDSLL